MNKIDLIIDALSFAQNSVWSKLNEQALAAARELQAEKQEHQFKYKPYGLRADENGNLSIGEIPQREWVGLTDIDIHVLKMNHDKVKVVYTDRAEDLTVLGQDVDVNGLINAIQTKLKELNT